MSKMSTTKMKYDIAIYLTNEKFHDYFSSRESASLQNFSNYVMFNEFNGRMTYTPASFKWRFYNLPDEIQTFFRALV